MRPNYSPRDELAPSRMLFSNPSMRCAKCSAVHGPAALRFPSQGRSLSRSPVRRGVDEAERESFPFAAVGSASSPLDNTIDCEEYEDDHRTKKYLECQHLHLHHNTRPDDTAVDLESQFGEAVVQLPPPTSPIEEVVIKPDDIIIACVRVAYES